MPEPKVLCWINSNVDQSGLSEALGALRGAGFEVNALPVEGTGICVDTELTLPHGSHKELRGVEEIYTFLREYQQGKYGRYPERDKNGK